MVITKGYAVGTNSPDSRLQWFVGREKVRKREKVRNREGSSPVQSVCRYSPSMSISLVRPTQCVQLDPLQLNAGRREGGREGQI